MCPATLVAYRAEKSRDDAQWQEQVQNDATGWQLLLGSNRLADRLRHFDKPVLMFSPRHATSEASLE
jgi:hypothetical protein